MVNLRYHIVSLTAVFLALGLGILAGTTVIDQQVVTGLRANTRALRNDLDRTRAQVSDLERRLAVWDRFGSAIEPPLLDGLLAGRAVVILSDARVSGDVLSELTEALTFAKTKRPTRLTLTEKWALDTSTEVEQLAVALRSSATDPQDLLTQAASRVGGRLGASANPRTNGDLIKTLTDADFLDVDDLPGAGSFPAANALVIVVSSGDEKEVPALDDFLLPVVKALSGTRIVGVAEPTTAARNRSLAELVRGDRDVSRAVCTIDHVDTVAGHISIVYALRALGAGEPAAHYGIRGGATAIAPDVRPA
jgi:copper transport outer membrane protein MctB